MKGVGPIIRTIPCVTYQIVNHTGRLIISRHVRGSVSSNVRPPVFIVSKGFIGRLSLAVSCTPLRLSSKIQAASRRLARLVAWEGLRPLRLLATAFGRSMSPLLFAVRAGMERCLFDLREKGSVLERVAEAPLALDCLEH